MHYISLNEARKTDGLRLILCAGTPGVWGEAVKAMFHVKGIDYHAVAMKPGFENPELEGWTAQSSAPAIVTAENKVLTHWEQFVWLAEELQAQPALIPEQLAQRSLMFGLLREIAGVDGLGWQRRLQSLHASGGPDAAEALQRLAEKYGYSDRAVDQAAARLSGILELLTQQLREQESKGSNFYIGGSLSALDLYSAIFIGVMIRPLPAEKIPMPEGMRWAFTEATAGTEHADSILFEHCERIFADCLPACLDF